MPLATLPTKKPVKGFIDALPSEARREEAKIVLKLIEKVTKKKAVVWGDNFIIGFGKYTYKRKGGKEEYEWFNVGFAPRKDKLTLYLTFDLTKEKELLKQLGPCTHGKGCLHIKKLEKVDLKILEKLIKKSKDATW